MRLTTKNGHRCTWQRKWKVINKIIRWYNSMIFDEDWFGSALGSPENSCMVSEGRFGNISTIYDPDKSIAKGGVKTNHNAYGYVTSTRKYQDLPRLRGRLPTAASRLTPRLPPPRLSSPALKSTTPSTGGRLAWRPRYTATCTGCWAVGSTATPT